MLKIKNYILSYKKILFSIVILTIIFGLSVFERSSNNIGEDSKYSSASILAAGDIMVHGAQLEAQFDQDNNTYSFDNNFKYVKKYIENSDYSLANLETTFAGNDEIPYSAYPKFNSPDALADALKNSGFDLLSTINNHSFDSGDLGVNRTLTILKEKGFDTVGTKQNSNDDNYIIKNINDIKFGITAYTFGQIQNSGKSINNISISKENENNMNIFDCYNVDYAFETINSTLKLMNNTDMKIVILHWGTEYEREPNKFQKELAQKLCDAGVDIIIGSHPHVVQPIEMISSSDNKHKSLVVYSLGNFLSNQSRENVGEYSEDGLMVNIDIKKDKESNETTINNVTCIPTWVSKTKEKEKVSYEIIPIEDDKILDLIDSNKSYLEKSYKNTSSLINSSNIINVVDNPFTK